MILVLLTVSLFTFVVFVKLPPSIPAIRAAGRHPSAQLLAQIRHRFGIDRPLYYQYWQFTKGLIPWPGLFLNKTVYFSWYSQIPVRGTDRAAVPHHPGAHRSGRPSCGWPWACPIGIVSAMKPGSPVDRTGMVFALVGVSAPIFWLSLVLLYVFHFQLGIAPSTGIPFGMSVGEAVLQGRFVLPWIALAVTSAAFYSRMTRGNLMETMTEDYIRTARSKGMSERRVIFKHGLRGALTPLVTMFGMDLAFLLGGAIIVESVFQLPASGCTPSRRCHSNDFPAVMGVTVLGAVFIVVANLVVDVVYAFLDPRVRYT